MNYKNQVRIIGGTHKRRIVRFPDMQGIVGFRPTPDRVRETLFNWLGQDLTGLACVDVFAGSGALAFEAASRGAQRVVAIESAKQAALAIAQNQRLLDLPNLSLVNSDAFGWLAGTRERFDVVFLDPPFAQDWWARLLPLLHRVCADEARVYCEFARELTELDGFERVKHGRAGAVHYHLFTKTRSEPIGPPTEEE